MPATLHIYVPLHFYYSLDMDPKLLHTSIKINKFQYLLTVLLQNMCLQKYASQRPYVSHMPKLLKVHQWEKYANT